MSKPFDRAKFNKVLSSPSPTTTPKPWPLSARRCHGSRGWPVAGEAVNGPDTEGGTVSTCA
ncbi:hypothetical protein [Azospirillum thiophilum]|uniref:hypothetical protein n=1 Tax=Azospirillum thiophilum TaxID=528244 RepID=UPI000ACC3D9C|nr:hypothetical protein [Azospirillum thiophilum]